MEQTSRGERGGMSRNPYNFPITRCPRCGGSEIAIRQYIHGYGEFYVDMETGDVDSTELHSGLQYRNTSKYAICSGCGKRLFKVDNNFELVR